jgi:hypothetical protein
MRSAVGSYNQATLAGHTGTATEAPPPEPFEPEVPIGAATEEADRSQKTLGGKVVIPGPVEGPVTKPPITAVGTITPPLPPALQRIQAQSEMRIEQGRRQQILADMVASGATQEQMQAWAEISQADTAHGEQLYVEHFQRAKQNVRQLRERVDQARSLAVNPYNWHESIGRGGRVAAAFATLTGGFAAGQLNPNTALKMMDAAIDRDIAAQEYNIKSTYENLKLTRDLNQDESRLFNEQLNALNELRAINYAAIVGRIQAAQQTALTEAHQISYQTAEDHYNLKLVSAFAAAQKEYLRLDVDGPIRNAAQLRALQSTMGQYEQMLAQPPQAGQPTSAQPVPSAPTAAGPSVPQGRKPVSRGGPATAASSRGGAARVVAPQGPQAAESLPGPSAEDEAQQMSVGPQTQVQPAATVQRRVIQPREEVSPEEQQLQSQVNREVVARNYAPTHVGKYGSYARTIAAGENRGFAGITTWGEAIQDLAARRPIRNGGMMGTDDAEVVANLAPEPHPELYEGGEASAAYKFAKETWDRGRRFPEMYERPGSISGERSTITAGGKTYRVLASARDKASYDKVRAEVTKAARATDSLMKMAELVRLKGFSGIFTDEGLVIPGITTSDPPSLEIYNEVVTQAMTYIKAHDPTARISDKDLEVGKEAATPYLTKTSKFIDLVQSLNGIKDNTARKQAERFLTKVAVEAARIMWREIENDVVPDYNTVEKMAAEMEKVDRFVYGGGAPK